MSTTLTIDATGGAFIPASLLGAMHLKPGARLRAEVFPDAIALMPEVPQETQEPRLVRRANGRLVAVGCEPFDAVAAIKATREDRQDSLRGERGSGT